MAFTPHTDGPVMNAAAFNLRLQELDDSIEDVKDGTTALAAPDITSFANANHDHSNAANGGQITETAIDSSAASGANEAILSDGVGGTSWGAILTSVITTKGDLLGYDTGNARIPVGTDGHTLFADSAQAVGVKWDSPLRVAVGEYTGDGTGAAGSGGQVIGGLPFQPDVVIIAHKDMINALDEIYVHTRTGTVNTREGITAIGATSFTVSDGAINLNPNIDTIDYVFIIAETNA